MLNFLNLIFLFVSIFIFIFLSVVLGNLFLKSYKPKKTLFFITGVMAIFIVNVFLAYGAMQSSIAKIRNNNNQQTTKNEPQEQQENNLPNTF